VKRHKVKKSQPIRSRWRLSGIRRLVRGVVSHGSANRIIGLSAEITFYELLAIFPLLVCIVNSIGLFFQADALLLYSLQDFVPPPTLSLIESWLAGIHESSAWSMLSVSAIVALWGGSAGVGAFMDAFALINGTRVPTRLVKRIWLRVFFTAFGTAGLVSALLIWVVGPYVAEFLFESAGMTVAWQWLWFVGRIPCAIGLMVLGLMVFYEFLARSGRSFLSHWPGAVFATVFFLLASQLFSLYVRHVDNFNATFGSLGVMIMLLLWLQALNLSILIGEVWNVRRATEEEQGEM